jgi:predicted nucleotidyltransferase
MVLNLKQFKKDFLEANLLQILQKNFQVVFVWVAGSTLTGLADATSDLDIGVLIADDTDFTQTTRNEDYFIYKPTGTKIQWIYDTVSDITTPQPAANQRNIGWAQFRCLQSLEDDAVLYINPRYHTFVKMLFQNKEAISKYAMWLYFNDKAHLINTILTSNSILQSYQVKSLYHLCWAAEILLGQPSDPSFLKALKHGRDNPLSKDYLKQVIIQLTKLQKYFLAYPPTKPLLTLTEDSI